MGGLNGVSASPDGLLVALGGREGTSWGSVRRCCSVAEDTVCAGFSCSVVVSLLRDWHWAVLKVVSVSEDTLTEKLNLRLGSRRSNLNYSVVDVKWNPSAGAVVAMCVAVVAVCVGGRDVDVANV